MILFENISIIERYLNTLHIKDATQERQELVDAYLQAHPIKKMLYHFAEPLLKVTAFRFAVFFLCYVYFSPRGISKDKLGKNAFFFKNTNEEKLIEVLSSHVFLVRLRSSFLDKLLNILLAPLDGLYLLKMYVQFLTKRSDNEITNRLFVYVRSCEYLVWVLSGTRFFSGSKLTTVMVSTEGNPHGLAFLACAQISKKKSVFLSHSHLPLSTAPFTADIAVLHGIAAKWAYDRGGCVFEKTYFYTHSFPKFNQSLNMRRPRVLLALSKKFSWSQLTHLIQKNNDCDFYVRYHPTAMDMFKARREQPAHIRGELFHPLRNITQNIDMVWAGNSNVHLDFLSLSTPSFFVPEIEAVSAERLPFLNSASLVLQWEPSLGAGENLQKFSDYSQTPHWATEYEAYCNTLDKEIQSLAFLCEKESIP